MKDSLTKTGGFSVLEVMLALAIAMVAITGSLEVSRMVDYWILTSEISRNARSLAEEQLAGVRQNLHHNFSQVVSIPTSIYTATGTVLDRACAAGGTCYQLAVTASSISSCAKTVMVDVSWKILERYPTSSVRLMTYGVNQADIVARGGDCIVVPLATIWSSTTVAHRGRSATSTPTFTTGLDALDDRLYVVASSAPQLRIYATGEFDTPHLIVTSNLLGNRLNAIDVIRDPVTGRRYAFIMQHTRTGQLLVVDVTKDIPVITATLSLQGTDQLGSFPQGWRVVAYDDRLYVTTRETAGAELHIFSIENPAAPIEHTIAARNLARTVNDMAVIERQDQDGATHRYVLLTASAALKEFSIVEVTDDLPVERVALDLPGSENLLSIAISDNDVFLGRQVVSSGPELYHYDMTGLLEGNALPVAASEVGADVHTLRLVGDTLILGTSKSSGELQLWHSMKDTWNPIVANSGRITATSVSRLAPLGVEVGNDRIITISQSATQVEQCTLWSAS